MKIHFFKVLTVFKAFSEVISIPENTLNKSTKEDCLLQAGLKLQVLSLNLHLNEFIEDWIITEDNELSKSLM